VNQDQPPELEEPELYELLLLGCTRLPTKKRHSDTMLKMYQGSAAAKFLPRFMVASLKKEEPDNLYEV
jgi:hypothetical protein